MTIHSLVLISDSFSCNCNSIQSPVSIVHLRVNLTFLIPLLRVYINYSIFNAIQIKFRVQYSTVQFQLAQQCIQMSTRINSSMYIVHTSFVLLACNSTRVCWPDNATWCQNRGCICISSTRRTYGRIHSSFLHPAYIRTIILWTELFPKKRREKIQGEILQSIFEYSGVSTFLQELQEYSVFYSVSTRNPATPSNSAYRINSSPRNTTTTRLIPCRLLPATVPRVSKHSTRQNKASGPPYSTPSAPNTSRLPVILPGRKSILGGRQHPRSPYSSSQASSKFYTTRILPGEIGFIPKG